MKFPNIDQKQARRQLELLGYKWNDNVFLRFFYPTDDPRKNTDKGRKADRLNWQQIEAYQKQGRGVYFVINGGGHKNADVTEGRAFFIEHDHLPKEEQQHLWKKLGLPKPSLQVDTGGRSLHSFWVSDKPVPIPQWCELQKDLLEYTDGDRSIKNPARVMRLAGAWHIKIDEEGNPVYNQSKIISDSGQKYSYEELRATVPSRMQNGENKGMREMQNAECRMQNGVIPNSECRMQNSYEQIQIPVPQPIPLLECCRVEVREWVKTGVPQGQGRNDTAINVGLELIAVERYLQQISQPFTDSARQLFTEYCQKSGMTPRENEERFMWCLEKNPNPSCGEEGIAACIRGWYWKNSEFRIQNAELGDNNSKGKSHRNAECRMQNAELGDNNSKGKGHNSASKNNRKSPTSNQRAEEINIRERLKEILAQDYSLPELTENFNQLSQETSWTVKEIRQLAVEMDDKFEQEYSRSERKTELQQLQKYKRNLLNLHELLPLNYAEPMSLMGKWMEAPNAALLTGFMPTFSSCLHPETRMVVKECIGFVEPAIIYSGIVTESGQRKSPLINALIDPLKQLQAEEIQRHREEEAEYEREYAEWEAKKEEMSKAEWKDAEPTPPSPPKEFYVDKGTIEAIDDIKSKQPDTGLLWLKDELSGLFNSYNAYKKGKGDDKESVLSGWNGRGVKKNLKGGEKIFLQYDSMSIFGAIQDTTLQKKMGNFDDEQGEWARFLWCLIPLKALRLPKRDRAFFLDFLKNLYQKARSLKPQQYRFAPDAQSLYDDYHYELELRRTKHPRKGMRAAISKMEGYTARLALCLYLIWQLEAGNLQPSIYVPKKFVKGAIILSEFYLSQVNLIHNDGAASLGEGGLTPKLNVIVNKLEQFGELTARKVQSTINFLRKVKAATIRQYFVELAKLGYGKLVGAGNKLKLVFTADSAVGTAVGSAVDTVSAGIVNLQGLQPQSNSSAVGAVTADKSAVSTNKNIIDAVGADKSAVSADKNIIDTVSADNNVIDAVSADNNVIDAVSADNKIKSLRQYSNNSSNNASFLNNNEEVNGIKKTGQNREELTLNNVNLPQKNEEFNDVAQEKLLHNQIVNSDPNFNIPETEKDLTTNAVQLNADSNNSTNSSNSTCSSNRDADYFSTADPPSTAPPTAIECRMQNSECRIENGGITNYELRITNGGNSELRIENAELRTQKEEETMAESSISDHSSTSLTNHNSTSLINHQNELTKESLGESKEVETETLSHSELKALLMACETLGELKKLKKEHENLHYAYNALTPEQQLRIDGIAATSVPYEVFKYTGGDVKENGQVLKTGQLVYIDPQAPIHKSSSLVPVWLMRGVQLGWRQSVSVIKDYLLLVEKAIIGDPWADELT